MQEIGQLIMTGIEGTTLKESEKKFLSSANIGGVLLFSHNYEDPAQLAELVNSIQQQRNDYPLFIAVDQEGGRVQRFKSPFSTIPSMFNLGKLNSPKMIFDLYEIVARELKACGINYNLAPVCDVWINPKNKVIGDRSFSNNTEVVSKNISSVIRSLQTHGVIGCAKHFPGHGATLKDSHFDLPIIKTSQSDWEVQELPPFIKAVKSRVETIMMAHVVVDFIDQDLPCSLSSAAYKMLREKLKFKKIIITDDMQMKAITDHWGLEQAAIMALNAGADIVEYRDLNCAQQSYNAIEKAVADKKIKKERIVESFKRIMKVKEKYLKNYNPVYIPDISEALSQQKTTDFIAQLHEKIDQNS